MSTSSVPPALSPNFGRASMVAFRSKIRAPTWLLLQLVVISPQKCWKEASHGTEPRPLPLGAMSSLHGTDSAQRSTMFEQARAQKAPAGILEQNQAGKVSIRGAQPSFTRFRKEAPPNRGEKNAKKQWKKCLKYCTQQNKDFLDLVESGSLSRRPIQNMPPPSGSKATQR